MTLSQLVDQAQSTGRYVLHRTDLLALGSTTVALQNAVRRLVAKGRLAVPRRGFYVIVPLEYRTAGSPPASWFVDDLMKFQARPYYVGLLSAAAIYGAAHQAPQELQVVSTVPFRTITVGRVRLRFVVKRRLDATPTEAVKTETGSMKVSTPEATALDLVRYVRAAGGLSNVATVLVELAERLDPARLGQVVAGESEAACLQRLGYLLDHVGRRDLAHPITVRLAELPRRSVPLSPGRAIEGSPRDETWRLIVNDAVEVEASA